MGYNRGWHGLGGSGEASFPDLFLDCLPVPLKTGQNSAPEQKKSENVVSQGPQWDPKGTQNSQKGVSGTHFFSDRIHNIPKGTPGPQM